MAGKPKKRADVALLDSEGDKVFERIASGDTLRTLCAAYGVSMGSLHAWVSSPERAERYARARVERAAMHAAKIEQLADDVESGAIDPQAARASFDMRKWTAAKLDPQTYADQRGPLVNISIDGLHMDSLRKADTAQVIDALTQSE